MSNKRTTLRGRKFWKFLSNIHLYSTKAEGLFKAVIILVSWIGGICFEETTNGISSKTATGTYLFSLALLMEYAVPLVLTKEYRKKLLPFMVCAISIGTLACAFSIMVNNPFTCVSIQVLKLGTIIPIAIILGDVVLQLIIEPIPITTFEKNLKDM